MKFTYLTLFPDLIKNYLNDALLKKAESNKILEFSVINLRTYSDNKYKSVDDAPYGGGDGMLLRPDIADSCFKDLYCSTNYNSKEAIRIYLSPQGKKLDQALLHNLSKYNHLILLCGRYGGVDQRILNRHIDLEISLGDFVLSGGELAALALTESLSRFVPHVLGHEKSVVVDSFYHGLLEAPQFTKPSLWDKEKVPDVLLSGHHDKIKQWQNHVAILITWKKRYDLYLIEKQKLVGVVLKKHVEFVLELKSLSKDDIEVLGLTHEDLSNYLNEVNCL